MADVTLTLDEVRALTVRTLRHLGASADNADAVADVIATAERDDCKAHGLFRLPGYCVGLQSGRVYGKAVPEITELAPGVLRLDARRGFSPLALQRGRAPLAAKARSQGIAAMSIVNSYHFAALWYEVEALAEDGLAAFAFVNSRAYVAPAGGTERLFGTNPMAFGWPRKGRPPMVFDQASSAAARGEIMIHARDGKAIPEGWALGRDGGPTTDAAEGLKGAQLPFGGHKGSAIALMVELLAAALLGDFLSFEASVEEPENGGPAKGGELLIAIDPARFVPGGDASASLDHAEALFQQLLSQEGARLPSDRRYAARRRTAVDGVRIPESLYDDILALTK